MAKISYRPGAEVLANGSKATIVKNVDMDRFLVRFENGGKPQIVRRLDISPIPDGQSKVRLRDSLDIEDLEEAEKRLEIIKPFLGQKVRGREEIDIASQEIGVSVATIYRWITDYENSGILSVLAPKRKGSQKGQKRLQPEIEAIIEDRIQSSFLKRQRVTKKNLHRQISADCKQAGYKAPGYATICRRVDEISEFEKTKKRRGPKQAQDRYGAAPGTYGEAAFPLSVVQIDHTQLNIFVVDSEERQTITRPWITLAIDVYSRMITGLYISLEAPSANSVGLCLLNSILEKEDYLKSVNVDGDWPVWGLMHVLHCDNAKEFRGKMLTAFCKEWGITLQWRAVTKPEWGAHIERMNGTLKSFLDGLEGTTFRGPRDRREYDSEGRATFTIDELETMLVTHIVNDYHQRKHSTLQRPPIKQWNDGVLGDYGCGIPDPISDTEKLRLELLPFEERTVQRHGISWDNVTYFNNSLRPWIKAKVQGKARKFIVRRDPRNISHIYFYDPTLKEYLKIPYRNIGRPVISLWDLRTARKRLTDSGRTADNEDIIFRAYEEIERIKQCATKKTKKMRKISEQKKRDKQVAKKIERPPKQETQTLKAAPTKPSKDEKFAYTEEDLKPKFERW